MSFRYRAGEEPCTRRRRTMTAVTAKSIGNGLVNVGHSTDRQIAGRRPWITAARTHRRAQQPPRSSLNHLLRERVIIKSCPGRWPPPPNIIIYYYYYYIIDRTNNITRARLVHIRIIIIARSCPLSPNILLTLYCRTALKCECKRIAVCYERNI